jgi:nucleoside phosphorylase
MNSNHYRALTLRTLVAICLTALLVADSQAQTEAALKIDKDGSGVDIVVQGALDSELQPLLAALEGKERIQIAAWTFWRGRIGVKRVVVSRTEVGPINAVAATTLAVVSFKPKRKTFGLSSEDMESAFSAGAAEGLKTRFLAIRVISDSEFHSPKLEEAAGEYCAAFVVEVIRRMK